MIPHSLDTPKRLQPEARPAIKAVPEPVPKLLRPPLDHAGQLAGELDRRCRAAVWRGLTHLRQLGALGIAYTNGPVR